ncbi:ATP-binding protein [Arthrobacter sp. I2-34]|uniref:ATP-binding protein n=1 Tax=Arthrobacter hankyongi TaxID=2904801 RepID=A0ABS9L8K0_9MICC|nr:AAA family ATPase [Arthrobacter hankyongi]MCG2622990.1 ATP-binding protein [Arthrobacter hankyongi]
MTTDSSIDQTAPWDPHLPPYLRGGDPEAFGVRVASVAFEGGESIKLPEVGVTAVVGGNNVGKSTLLKQVKSLLEHGGEQGFPFLVQGIELNRRGTSSDMIAWLGRHGSYQVQNQSAVQFMRHSEAPQNVEMLSNAHDGHYGQHSLAYAYPLLGRFSDAQDRLYWTEPTQRRSDFSAPPTHPVHVLEDDPDALGRIQRHARDIFNQELTLDRLSGSSMLRVGTPGIEAPPVDQVTHEYRNALASLPPLNEQGDGVRNALGILMPLVTPYQIILIDEPEAFLHPPQARFLGQALSEMALEYQVQIILATHDRNLLAGLLDAPETDVSVVLLNRNKNQTQVRQLPAESVRELWEDPALKYTNMLDGLFHRLVVIAENERDCQFYAAALEAAYEDGKANVSPYDVLFVPSSGKAAIARLAGHLKKLGVNVVVSPDLDVLNDQRVIKALVAALGGDWDKIEKVYNAAIGEFVGPRTPRKNRDVLNAIQAVLGAAPDGPFTGESKRAVNAMLSVQSPWTALKDYGTAAFKSGAAAAEQLLQWLDDLGICCVRVGELEGFGREIQRRKGLDWLTDALTAQTHKKAAVQEHVARLVATREPQTTETRAEAGTEDFIPSEQQG